MVQVITAEIVQCSIGDEIPIPVTVTSCTGTGIVCATPTAMIADIYIGCEFEVISCTDNTALNGHRYLITDNTDNDLVIDTDISSDLDADDTGRIRPYGAGPISTTSVLDTDTVIGVLPTVDYPDPDFEHQRYHTSGGGREPHIIAYKEIKHVGSLPVTLQNGRILKYLMGNLYESGADKAAGGGSDIDGATTKWDLVFDVTAGTNYAATDYIQVGTGTTSEVRKITDVTSNTITVDFPLEFAHADEETCNEVEAPFTHVMTVSDNPLPSFTLERGVDMATDWVVYYLGTVISKGELTGEDKGELQAKLDILSSRQFKNTANSMSSITLLNDNPFICDNAVFTFWSNPLARVKSFSCSIDNKIEPGIYWRQASGPYALDMIPKKCDVELVTTAVPYDSQLWDQLLAQSAITCQIDFTRTAASDTAQIKCENCKIKSAPHNQPEEGELEVEMTIIPKTTTLTFVDSIYHY